MTAKSRIVAAVAILLLALPAVALAESWSNVTLIDQHCAAKFKDKADEHTRDCDLMCATAGYGVYTAEGQYLKFDEAGSKLALALLKSSDKEDHLRVDVTGDKDGETIKVKSIQWAK